MFRVLNLYQLSYSLEHDSKKKKAFTFELSIDFPFKGHLNIYLKFDLNSWICNKLMDEL